MLHENKFLFLILSFFVLICCSKNSPQNYYDNLSVEFSGDGGKVSGQGGSDRVLQLVGTEAQVGATVQVPVEFVAAGDENAVAFSVSFDPANLEYVSAVSGTGLPSGAQVLLNTGNDSAGRVGVLIGVSPGAAFTTGTHEVLVLSLRIKSAGNGSLTVAFNDSPVQREFVSTDAEELSGDYLNASIVVSSVQPTLKLDVSQISNTGTRLILNGAPDQSFQIMVSTNLVDWNVLTTVTSASTGMVEAWDPEAKQYPIRFYRAVAQ